MVKVSVIIPAYNTETYINHCVDSLVNQSLEELEIVIVDDGSTDNTLSLLREYEEKYPNRVRVFTKKNGGQASARNLALKHAQGEYIGFVDSDDWVDLNMYELMYQKAKEECADIVVCDMSEHFPDKEMCHAFSQASHKLEYAGSSCNKIFRRAFAEGVIFPEGLWYEDFEYSAKQIMKAEHISVVHEGLYHYNCRDGSTMHNTNAQKNKDILTVLNHIYDFAVENGWEETYKRELENLYVDHVLYTTINRLEEQNGIGKREVINYLRKAVTKKYPRFYKAGVLQQYPIKKRIVTILNAIGLSHVAKFIFDLKKSMRNI